MTATVVTESIMFTGVCGAAWPISDWMVILMADIRTDADEVLTNLKRLADTKVLHAAVEPGLEKACLRVVADAKRNCPVDKGTLCNTIQYSIEEEGETLAGYVGSNLEYAPYVHQGTGIYAKDGNGRKQVPWVYYSEKDGKRHVTSGSKPRPFL